MVNLAPKFYYTLPLYTYLKSLFIIKPDLDYLAEYKSKIYFHNTGRTGLRLLLSSIGTKKLNVGVQVYTCNTIFEAIKRSGNQITFIDINDEYKLDMTDLKKKIDKIDVLIITNIFGLPEDFDKVKKIAVNKVIIEDCAHSFLSKYKGKYTGLSGDASIFSFGIGKFPPIGSGGMTIINNSLSFPYFEREYSMLKKETGVAGIIHFLKIIVYSLLMKAPLYGAFTFKVGKKLDIKYDFVRKLSFNESKGFKIDKRILMNNFKLFKKLFNTNSENFYFLNKNIHGKTGPVINEKSEVNCYVYPILFNNKRDHFFNNLIKNGIEAGKHFNKSIEWAKNFGYNEGECPNAERVVKKILTIPAHIGISRKKLLKISDVINKYE